ncbi:MAG: hypothetical protein DRG78_06895 [Epsilonproteobacteria bacterium]|nr:MAG: hypothetical protein DRG78_06895 [Campylobacterota bacterium]
MQNIIFSKNSILINLAILAISFLCLLYLTINSSVTIFLIVLLSIILSSYFILEKKFVLFNPFTVFTLYFYTVVISSLYLYTSNFEKSVFINDQSFSTPLIELLNISLVYIIVSYIFAYLGYRTFRKNFKPNIDLNSDGISIKVLNITIVVFAIIGTFNFIFNVLLFAGGNPFEYISNVSTRHLEWKNIGGTTLGYLFGYVAGYLWLYKILKLNKKISILFLFYVFITIFMKASTGRIFGTLIYALSYLVIYYFVCFDVQSKKHKKYFLILFLISFMGLLFYFFRITSSLAYNNLLSTDFLSTILEFFKGDLIMYYAVDKGNIPNIAVLMKIIDGWGIDTPFLYGESLFTWMYGVIPSNIRPEGYQPSVIIKHVWYSYTPGGHLPPTGMGEMYANFWYFGAVFGMYLFGSFTALIYNLLKRFNNYWYLVVYTNITLGFILLYPKGEFDNLSFWAALPIGLTYLLLKFIIILSRRKNEN